MYKVEKFGKGGITARIVADSVSEAGDRITTFELEYHRYIHSEIMTHRLFSRNAMSSRAVPVKKMIEQVDNSPATPIHWGANQSGMQADRELPSHQIPAAKMLWLEAARNAENVSESMNKLGIHKQVVNRILEPFQMMKVVLTATEFENFFWLRCDKDAQPEIQELANCMFEAMNESEPELLVEGVWHTPYVMHEYFMTSPKKFAGYAVKDENGRIKTLTEEEALAISSSASAQVSYRSIDNSYEKAMKVYERLGVGGSKIHASPFEHLATPIPDYRKNKNTFLCGSGDIPKELWKEGITHMNRKGDLWSGNFKGWIQYRQLLKGHTKW